MPATDLISPYVVSCAGGLVLNKDVFSMSPGEALILRNFEPDIKGGYRRVNGTELYNTTIVPQGSSTSSFIIDCSIIFNNQIIVARGGDIHRGTTSGSWTSLATGLGTSTRAYDFEKYNFNGTDKIIIATGHSAAQTIDTSWTVDPINATFGGTAPTNPKFVKAFQNHMFYAGATNPQEVLFSVPFVEDDHRASHGAGSFNVDSEVVGLKVFRNELFVFCTDRIYKLTGTSFTNFSVQEVTRNIGCRDGGSIQEIGGDVIFLAPDGLRTIAGTARIGDVELGSISRQIQTRIDEVILDRVSSLVIRDKSQYRLYYPQTAGGQSSAKGIIGVLKSNVNTNQIGFEFSDMIGIKPACTDSDFISAVETQVFGGFDGYIYKMETGNTFANGTTNNTIVATYRSPDMVIGDPGLRKYMQRVNLNYEGEGTTIDAELAIRYDYDSINTPQPNKIVIQSAGGASLYGTALYGTALYGASGTPLIRQTVEGSGFAVALKIDDRNQADAFSVKGFQLEFTPGGRR
jgi:hypothetical protein